LLSDFLQKLSNFSQWLSDFHQRLCAFRNAFLLSAMPFCFPQRLSAFRNSFLIFLNGFPIFPNGFPLSKKSKKIYLWRQVYKRSLFELCISCQLLSKLRSLRYYVYISPKNNECIHRIDIVLAIRIDP
jgi:hypothetical protein